MLMYIAYRYELPSSIDTHLLTGRECRFVQDSFKEVKL